MTKKKKLPILSLNKIWLLFTISAIIFSLSLYYKQYLAIYIIHSIVILLIMLVAILPFIFKKYKKKQKLLKIITILLSIALITSGITIYNHNDRLASEGQYIGIDVSKWNGNINLQLAKQEIDFVIIRCGYTSLSDGTTIKEDLLFEQNINQCIQLSIPYGVYYYSLARDETQAKKEADFVTSKLNGRIPELGVFIDLEDEEYQGNLSNQQLANVAVSFLDNIQNENKKGIYANHHWWSTKLTDSRLDNYIKWKARYNDNKVLEDGFSILQYSETGNVKGINTNVDLNLITNKYW